MHRGHFYYPLPIHVLLLFIFICARTSAQKNSISGQVIDSLKVGIPFCTAGLVKEADSTLVKGTVCDDKGNFIFEDIKPGKYRIKLFAAGYKTLFSPGHDIDSINNLTLPSFILRPEGKTLDEVSIAAFKPVIEFKKGMVVMNVENNIMASGNTVLELLRRIPGVIIDAQNNITINGQSGVRFLFDGRLQQIPTEQLMNVLSGMPAESVSTIELIKNPPAKYDAAGSGGLINIVFKKAKMKGLSGSVSQSLSRGNFWRSGNGFNLNIKSNRVSLFSNFFYSRFNFETNNYLFRRIQDSTTSFEAVSIGRQLPWRSVLNARVGLEYEISKKWRLSLNAGNAPSAFNNHEVTRASILRDNPFPYDYFDFTIDTREDVNCPNLGGSLSWKTDTLGSEVILSSDYTKYTEDYSKYTINSFYNPLGVEIQKAGLQRTSFDNIFEIFTQKLDMNKKLGQKWELESGFKAGLVNISNRATVELSDTLSGDLKKNDYFSNNYLYHEKVLAAYLTLARSFKKIETKAGLRSEHTDINGSTSPKTFTITRNYINFFPSASIDYKRNDKHGFQLNYSYRIDRPQYYQINPTRVYNEALNYGAGNPKLNPQYSHVTNLEYQYKDQLTLTMSYQPMKGFIYYYFYADPRTKSTIDTIFNYPKRNSTSFSAYWQRQIKWFKYQLFGLATYRTFSGEVQGIQTKSETVQLYGNFNLEFMLPKDFKVQANGYYVSRFFDGVQIYYPAGSISLTVLRSFLKKKLDISLSMYDVFYSERFPFSNSVGGQYSYYTERNDSRRFRFFIIYKFGKMNINRQSKGGQNEEKARLKDNSGN